MNRIDKAFKKSKNILSIYFSAGYPRIGDTIPIMKKLQESGVDMIEIGMPFSDPLADGPVIQKSSNIALKNGMTSMVLFKQLERAREEIKIPLIIMGYFNPIMQFGVEKFCEKCNQIGIDGLIIPDLPVEIYQKSYRSIFKKNGLYKIFLITPQTSRERINLIDKASNGFIYMVSTASVTGAKKRFGDEQIKYFNRVNKMKLKNPTVVGFGVSNFETFRLACENSSGAIIGSAFIKVLEQNDKNKISDFVSKIKGK